MKISVTIFVILISICVLDASILDPVVENVVHIDPSHSSSRHPGTWKKKTIWKSRWVKEWKSAKVMKPTWRKVWSPVLIKEWIPFPKLPPEWKSFPTPPFDNHHDHHVHDHHHPTIRRFSEKFSLWDPMPYPESQQPPPAIPPPVNPTLEPVPSSALCHYPGCEGSAATFTRDQISKIIGSHRYKKATDDSQALGEKSESVETGGKQETKSIRSARQSNFFPFRNDHRFGKYPEPPRFLVPPKLTAFRNDNSKFDPRQNKPNKPHGNFGGPGFKSQKPHSQGETFNRIQPVGFRQWTPITSSTGMRNPIDHGSKLSDRPYKFEVPNVNFLTDSNQEGNRNRHTGEKRHQQAPAANQNLQSGSSQRESNLLQHSALVGEYHYSEIDYDSTAKPEQNVHHQLLPFKPLAPATSQNEYADFGHEKVTKPEENAHQMEFKFLPMANMPNTELQWLQEENHNIQLPLISNSVSRPIRKYAESTLKDCRGEQGSKVTQHNNSPEASQYAEFVANVLQEQLKFRQHSTTTPPQHAELASNSYLVQQKVLQHATPTPPPSPQTVTIKFEQEKGVTKEIIPVNGITPSPQVTTTSFEEGNGITKEIIPNNSITPSPNAITTSFEQEKAITKEIIPVSNITPTTFPANHRSEYYPVYRPPEKVTPNKNATATENLTMENSSKKTNSEEKLKTATRSQAQTKDQGRPNFYVHLTEEALFNALQKNYKKNKFSSTTTKLPSEETTTISSTTESSSSSNDFTTTESFMKSPVFIVTPINSNNSN